MYIKKPAKPEDIPRLEALLRRLPDEHPQRPLIEKDLAKQLRGWQGEKAVSYYLDFLPEKEYLIFIICDSPLKVPLPNGLLVLTTRFALILECKNFSARWCLMNRSTS